MTAGATFAGLSLFPNEHILGSLGRLHFLSGNYHFDSSCKRVTQDMSKLSPYVVMRPAYKETAEKLSSIHEMEPEKVLDISTPIALYRSFLYSSQLQDIAANRKIYIPDNLRNMNHASSWRWCPCCAQDDLDNYGIPYWRLEHQLPSVCRCSTHLVSLHCNCVTCTTSSSVIRHNLVPPLDTRCGHCNNETRAFSKSAGQELDWLEEAIRDIVNGNVSLPPMERTRERIQQALGIDDAKMITTVSGRKAYAEIRNKLVKAVDHEVLDRVVRVNTRVSPQMAVILFNLQKILFRTNYTPGPIIILLIVQALFGSLAAYVGSN